MRGTGRESLEFFSACNSCGRLGAKKAGRGGNRTGAIHEGGRGAWCYSASGAASSLRVADAGTAACAHCDHGPVSPFAPTARMA